MRPEVVALETIHHRSTPRVVAHNTEHHADITVPLFAVFDYVKGPTLAEFVERRGLDRVGLDEAREMVIRLSTCWTPVTGQDRAPRHQAG